MIDQPSKGHMVLFDWMEPPLRAGNYRLRVSTDVTADGVGALPAHERYMSIVAPRWSLAATEVAGVFPPRNGHGNFGEALPHVVLGRRTLPWERKLDPVGTIGIPALSLRIDSEPPWLALLLFEEGECTVIKPAIPVREVLPPKIFHDLGNPDDRCEAIEAPRALVRALMPSVEELMLLTHVRQVNVEDRELAAGDSDGWFAVVMSNRVPEGGKKYRCCLVSVEGRSDLISRDPPSVASDVSVLSGIVAGGSMEAAPALEEVAAFANSSLRTMSSDVIQHADLSAFVELSADPTQLVRGERFIDKADVALFDNTRLVLLQSWSFECTRGSSFRELMQGLDVGMVGEVRGLRAPTVTDTGHLALDHRDLSGAAEKVWYRGPLVPFPLTRDALGPYHAADQARIVSPETGAEDISYAAAFEVGRLLAAADGRLAQELMRWRRHAYAQSMRQSTIAVVKAAILPTLLLDRWSLIAPVVFEDVIAHISKNPPLLADRFGLRLIIDAPGMQPALLKNAWNLSSEAAALALIVPDGSILAREITVAATAPIDGSISSVAADGPLLERLQEVRADIVRHAVQTLKETK